MMDRRIPALALTGLLSLGLLAGCGDKAPAATAAPTESAAPAPTETLAPRPTESILPTESAAPEETPSAGPEAAPSDVPASKPTEQPAAKPSSKPAATAKPSAKPTAKPAPSAQPTPKPSAAPAATSADIWSAIEQKISLPGMEGLDAAALSAVYGIDAGDLTDYVCRMPQVNVSADEYFIARVKSGKMDTVKAALTARQADLEEQWSQYLPDQYELVKDYRLVSHGDYVIFAIGAQAGDAVQVFDSYTK